MRKLTIDFDDVQKAMEDTVRDAFEYYLDKETGEVVILSEDIINRALYLLEEAYEDDMDEYECIEFDQETEIPAWIEEEVALALDVLLNEVDRYVRIPERMHRNGYQAMKAFADSLSVNIVLKRELSEILDGKGAFRRFKDALAPYPKERKLWFSFNAKIVREEISEWLKEIGIEARPES